MFLSKFLRSDSPESSNRLNQLLATMVGVFIGSSLCFYIVWMTVNYGVEFPSRAVLLILVNALQEGEKLSDVLKQVPIAQKVGVDWAGATAFLIALAGYFYQIWWGKAQNKKIELGKDGLKTEDTVAPETKPTQP